MKIKSILLLIIAFSFGFGCRKKVNLMNGNVIISGRVTDIISEQSVPNVVVNLIDVRQQYNLIGYGEEMQEVITTDTTDENGLYSFNITASNQYAYALNAVAQSRYYVYTDYPLSSGRKISSLGSHTRDLVLKRTAFARVNIQNVGYRDTVFSISAGDISIRNYFSGDTTVYTTHVGGQDNSFRFTINDLKIDTTLTIRPAPWDTVSLNFRY